MTSVNQDFVTYQGDDIAPIFTVLTNGVPVNLSTAVEIEWQTARDAAGMAAPAVTKTKTGGGITLPGGGADGKFQVTISEADTLPLTGYYLHRARVTDATNKRTTVTLGRMQVGLSPTSTYSGAPQGSKRDQVRFWIQDTAPPWKVTDGEIDFVLCKFGNSMLAAAQVARALAAKYAAMPSKAVGDFRLTWGELSKNYFQLAKSLQSQGQTFGLEPYSGGTSKADIEQVAQNPDRPRPPFRRNQFDNPGTGPGVTTGEGGWSDWNDDTP